MNQLQTQVKQLNKLNDDLYESIVSKFIETKGLEHLSFKVRGMQDDGDMVVWAEDIIINNKDKYESIDDFPADLIGLGGISKDENEIFFNNVDEIMDNICVLYKDEDEDNIQINISLKDFK